MITTMMSGWAGSSHRPCRGLFVPALALALVLPFSILVHGQGAPHKSSFPETTFCGTYPGRLQQEILHHRFLQAKHEFRRQHGLSRNLATAPEDHDEGSVAVIEDDGSIVSPPNPFDLSGMTLRFVPASSGGFDISTQAAMIDPAMGDQLPLGDDDTGAISFASGFTFIYFGKSYTQAHVNSNGNLTFGQGDALGGFNDFGVFGKELSDFLNGPPRIAGLFADLNPALSGGVFVKTQSDRVVVTWDRVFLVGSTLENTFQVTLFADGSIELAYSDAGETREGLIGLAPGDPGAALNVIDFTLAPVSGAAGALVERFNTRQEVDLLALGQRFFASHPDDFQFLTVLSNFSFDTFGAFAFELNISNDATGLGDLLNDGAGQDLFNDAALFGSNGPLESLVVLEQLSKYPDDPEQIFFGTNATVNILGQEAGHRWGAFVRVRLDGQRSDRLLGRDLAHWSFFHDTDASDLEGNRIRDNTDGSFTTIGSTEQYSQLDQYLIGLRDASEVGPFFFVDSPAGTSRVPGSSPQTGVTFGGTRRNLTVQDVIAEEGLREPTPATSRKIFRMAFILLVPRGVAPTAAEVKKVDSLRMAWERHFARASDYRGFMDTRLVRAERSLTTYLPLLEGDTERFTGIAIANIAPFPVSTKLTLYGDDGRILQLPGILNPSSLALGPGQQRALLDAQIFRIGFDVLRQGWIQIESTSRQVAAFFLVGDQKQTFLDGGLAQSLPISTMTFTRTIEGESALFGMQTSTEINLINPASEGATIELTLYEQTGVQVASRMETLATHGRLRRTLSELFPAITLPIESGHLEVHSTAPLVGFELVQFGRTLYGLPAQAHIVNSRLYSAQFASGGLGVFPAPFFTDLNLVNVDEMVSADVTIRLVGEDGRLLQQPGVTNPLMRTLPPKALLRGRADELFGFSKDDSDTEIHVGSILVEVSGGLVIGDVTFGDAVEGSIVAGLPLQSELLTDFIFAQVAEGESGDPPVGFFTGVAVLNPNPTAAELTIEVFTETGDLTGSSSMTLGPGQRFSRTLMELVPAAADQLRGYIRVRATKGAISAFELFGDDGLSEFLSAVPPQVVAAP